MNPTWLLILILIAGGGVGLGMYFVNAWMNRQENNAPGWLDRVWNNALKWVSIATLVFAVAPIAAEIAKRDGWIYIWNAFEIGGAIGLSLALFALLTPWLIGLEERYPSLKTIRGSPSMLTAMLCLLSCLFLGLYTVLMHDYVERLTLIEGALLGVAAILGARWLIRRWFPPKPIGDPYSREPRKPPPVITRPATPPSSIYRRAQRQNATTRRQR